jgi:hypothetical protein
MITSVSDTVTLFRPVGPKELELIRASGSRAFPPRLPEQPIFYPVLNEQYAAQIARDWNVKDSGAGYVTQFRVRKDFVAKYPIQTVGGSIHQELWVPAEDLAAFNQNIVGEIEVIAEFRREMLIKADVPTPLTSQGTHQKATHRGVAD